MSTYTDALQLISFKVSNYRSIREPVTLSMVASPKHDTGAYFTSYAADEQLLTTAGIYGPNAGGKSNLVRALFLLQKTIVGANNLFELTDTSEPIVPFLLDHHSATRDSSFEVQFEYKGRVFNYGFSASADQKHITQEWLKFSNTKQSKLVQVFTRSFNTVQVSTNMPIANHGISRSFRKQVSDQELFVTTLSKISGETIAHTIVSAWKSPGIFNTIVHDPLQASMQRLLEQPELKNKLLPLLHEADFSISDIDIRPDEDNDLVIRIEHTVRTNNGLKREKFDIEDESVGTKKFLSFALLLILSLEQGRLMVLDELGSTLHPSLMRYIVKLFHSKKRNPYNAQLITVTHDVNLIGEDIFGRDQVYFAEKAHDNATVLYRLSDLKNVRKSPNLSERYLRGDFGATPDILEEYLD